MRKHFLILMLLTLLPFAAWADHYEVEVTTYNGTATWNGQKPVVQPSWFTASFVGGGAPDAAQKAIIATGLKVKDVDGRVYNAGTYEYQLALKGDQTISDPGTSGDTYTLYVNTATTATLTITKNTEEVYFVPGSTPLAFVAGDLAYTGQDQALLTGSMSATIGDGGPTVPVIYTLDPEATTLVTFTDAASVVARNAGLYTVYYKVAGTDNYKGSSVWSELDDSKSIAKATTAAFNVQAVTGLVFDNTDQVLLAKAVADAPIVPFGADNLQYQIDGGDWTDLPETGLAGITGKSAKNAVAYAVKLRITADTEHGETPCWDEITSAAFNVTIAKATPTFTYVPTHENGGLPSGLVYDTHSHQLVLQEATAIVPNTEISVPLKYSIRRYRNVTGNYTSVTVKPFNELVGTVASNNYMIKAYNDETEDLNQVIETFENIEIAKATIPADAYTEPVAKNVRSISDAQDLVVAATWTGETSYGTFQYSLTNNGTDWSTDVPQGTDVAEYTVYWRILPTVVSDTRNYNIVSGNKTSYIIDKSKVTVTTDANQSFGYGTTPTIQKTVEWDTQGEDALNEEGLVWKWYDNAECSGDPIALPESGYYEVGNYYVKASGLAVTGTTAASQEIVYVPALVKITAGQIVASIDVSSTYGSQPEFTLTHVSGLSTTEAATLNAHSTVKTVTIKNKETGAIVTYKDGDDNKELKDVVLDSEAEGYNAAAKAALAKLNAGPYTLEATAVYTPNTNYALLVSASTLTVGAKSIAGAEIEVTTAADDIVYNAKNWGTTENPIEFTVTEDSGIEAADYDVEYSNNKNAGTATITLTGKRNYAGTKTQNFTIKKADLTITADNFTGKKAWTYGKPESTYTVTVEGQAEGETALEVGGTVVGVDDNNEETEDDLVLAIRRTSNETVGMHAGAIEPYFIKGGEAQVLAYNEPLNDIALNYNITLVKGDLQVAKGAVVIQLKEAVTATYGDDPATSINDAIKNIANYEYVSGLSELEAANFASFIDVAAATYVLGAAPKYEVGDNYTFTIDGATSTNYGVTINPGTFNVTPANITLYAKDQTIDWSNEATNDDTPNTTVSGTTVDIAAGALKYTDALTDVVASIVIASQNVGTNNISLTRAENNANYNIVVNSDGTNAKYGVLTVIAAPALALSTADPDLAAKLTSYNGKAMPVKINFTARNGRILSGERNWEKENWVTLTLPFDITVAELSKILGYAVVNVIDEGGYTTNEKGAPVYKFNLTMKGGYGKDVLPANKPFVVKTTDALAAIIKAADAAALKDNPELGEDQLGYLDFGLRTIVAPTAEDFKGVAAGGGSTFKPAYANKTINSSFGGNIWFLLGNYAKWAYIKSTSGASWDIVPFEGFIDQTGNASPEVEAAIFMMEDIDGTVTAIKGVEVDNVNGQKNAEGMYNLNGMKLNSVPTQKGVYIQNGKKVIIK